MNALIEDHWIAIKHILCYLQAMTSYDLHITRGSSFSFHGFTNAIRQAVLMTINLLVGLSCVSR